MKCVRILLCVLAVCLVSGCRADTNKNGFTLLPYDVKDQESSLDDLEVRQASDYQYILGSGSTNAQNNNTLGVGEAANLGNSEAIWSVKGGVRYPYLVGDGKLCITSLFGDRWGGKHHGVDFNLMNAVGERVYNPPIVSATDGVVHEAAYNDTMGNYVIVKSSLSDNSPFYLIYMHMKNTPSVSTGDSVTAGVTKLGVEGTTGDSTGEHLHLEVCTSKNGNPEVKEGRQNRSNALSALYGYNVNQTSTDSAKSNLRTESGGKMYVDGF